MNTLSYKTISANAATVTKEWVLIDAEDQVLGRLAAKVAMLLKGKTKTNYTPHVDCGDNVVIINAEKVRLTGDKLEDKIYLTHSGYPGGQKETTPAELLRRNRPLLLKKPSRGCSLKTVWEGNFSAIFMFMPVLITPTRPSNQNLFN